MGKDWSCEHRACRPYYGCYLEKRAELKIQTGRNQILRRLHGL